MIPRSDLHHGLVLPQQVPAVLPVRAQPRLPPPALLLLPAQLRTPVRRPLHTLDNGRSSPQNLIRDRYHVQDFVKTHHPVHGTSLYHLYKEYSFISVFVSKENCSWIYLFVIISMHGNNTYVINQHQHYQKYQQIFGIKYENLSIFSL